MRGADDELVLRRALDDSDLVDRVRTPEDVRRVWEEDGVLDPPSLAGATERNVVQIADPALKPKSRPSDRRQVRRNLEAGYTVELIPGEATTAAQRAAFLDLYEQTMRRAAPRMWSLDQVRITQRTAATAAMRTA